MRIKAQLFALMTKHFNFKREESASIKQALSFTLRSPKQIYSYFKITGNKEQPVKHDVSAGKATGGRCYKKRTCGKLWNIIAAKK